MDFSTKDIQKLVIKTGAPIMHCKKALADAEGNMEEAIKMLTKKNVNKNANDRRVGLLFCEVNSSHTTGVIIELSCETDIVSQAEDIRELGYDIMYLALQQAENFTDVKGLKALQMADGRTVSEHLLEANDRVGEKIDIRECRLVTNKDYVSRYSSANLREASLVWFSNRYEVSPSEQYIVASELALHVIAVKPKALDKDNIPAEIVQKERAIALDSAQQDVKNAGKPLEFLEKIVDAKLDVFFRENTLLNQPLFRSREISVADYVGQHLGDTSKVEGFDYIVLG